MSQAPESTNSSTYLQLWVGGLVGVVVPSALETVCVPCRTSRRRSILVSPHHPDWFHASLTLASDQDAGTNVVCKLLVSCDVHRGACFRNMLSVCPEVVGVHVVFRCPLLGCKSCLPGYPISVGVVQWISTCISWHGPRQQANSRVRTIYLLDLVPGMDLFRQSGHPSFRSLSCGPCLGRIRSA